ncbi:hypothetical protein NQZ68_032061 [Dissostichus eleginoides]|nr:hypothetical protein NQZ68_032061 [Dissostichus eleginoides]
MQRKITMSYHLEQAQFFFFYHTRLRVRTCLLHVRISSCTPLFEVVGTTALRGLSQKGFESREEEKKIKSWLLFCCWDQPGEPEGISREEDEGSHICIPDYTSYRLYGRLRQLRITFILCIHNATQITLGAVWCQQPPQSKLLCIELQILK